MCFFYFFILNWFFCQITEGLKIVVFYEWVVVIDQRQDPEGDLFRIWKSNSKGPGRMIRMAFDLGNHSFLDYQIYLYNGSWRNFTHLKKKNYNFPLLLFSEFLCCFLEGVLSIFLFYSSYMSTTFAVVNENGLPFICCKSKLIY